MNHGSIETFTAGRMSEVEFCAACELHHAAFPKAGRTLDEVLAKKRPVWMEGDALPGVVPGPMVSQEPPVRYAVRDESRAWLANAGIITRRIGTERGEMVVVGLLDVATAPAARGLGLGALVVRAAWSAVDDGRYPVCLFETGEARPFYEKLGARVVTNRFIDSTNAADPDSNPFTDEVEMIYPASADWPEGLIDLRGPGY